MSAIKDFIEQQEGEILLEKMNKLILLLK